MLRQIWQWLKRFFQGLFGVNKGKSRRSQHNYQQTDSLKPLSDTDYEFLFMQLLEGVIRGWDQKRVLKFFTQLEDRTTQYDWTNWLEGFGTKVLASAATNQELGIRMVRFGQLTEFLPSLRRLGQESYIIGQKILNKQKKRQMWESTAPVRQETPPKNVEIATVSETDLTEVEIPTTKEQQQPQEFTPLSPDQLLAHLYEDPTLADVLAKQLGLDDDSNPEHIVSAMVNQMIDLQNKVKTKEVATEETWVKKGIEQVNQGDLQGAIASWDQAISINPNSIEAWYNRGGTLGTLGRLAESLTCFETLVKLQPNDHMFWNGLGNTFYRLERWEDALNAWNQVLNLKPDYYQGWYNRACALEHLNLVPEAIESYQKALEIQPDFTLAQSRLTEVKAKLTN
jgi:Flp pilus assembly protein TadD